MSRAKMTLLGFYDYLAAVSVDLFAAFDDLPEGIDKDTLVSNIMLQGGGFEVTYADPYFLKAAIDPWISKWRRTFEKWTEALALEYDPISNYDRHEEWTDKHTGTVSGIGNTTTDGTHKGSNDDVTTTKVSAYDTEDFANRDQVSGKGSDQSTDKTITDSKTSTTNDLQDVRTGRAWGNIGVTTSVQMLSEHMDFVKWNLYEHITDLFLSEFTIMVYE